MTRLAERSGRLLERISNGAPRGMTVQRQNPAYRLNGVHRIVKGRLKQDLFQTAFLLWLQR